ncbi:MAG: tRNA pseudouridine(38-40) synthase TruA [Spirochaetia bacterium]|nr:tRNA pseudouridine(38-40) synthase TruA [Spirochaetia bacterium]
MNTITRPVRPTHFPLMEGKRRIKLVISYDGAPFYGWQKQHNGPSIQECIEKALCKILKEQVKVHGSGRTDSKVHALGQVAHFDTSNLSIPASSFPEALHHYLNHEIRIVEGSEVGENFHARFSSISREYHYMIKDFDSFTPFDKGRVCRVTHLPDINLLNEYAAVLVGTHNFSSFCASQDQSLSRIRDLMVSYFTLEKDLFSSTVLMYVVKANAFMMHQVRSMVGTMLQLGEKGAPVEEMRAILASRDRLKALRTAPPDGLYLYRIEYNGS